MKLIELLVKELPNRGGWPEGVANYKYYAGSAIAFDEYDREVHGFRLDIKISEKTASKVTREQYESALEASEGWIEWGGGECPVDSDEIVEVKYRKPNPYQFNNDRAGDFIWLHTGSGGDIISYRLQQPGINSRANDDRLEQDLNECIGQGVDMPEWSGDGFPPAGCKCEVMESNPLSVFDKWTSCTVIHFNLREGRETQACIIDDNGDFAILYGNDGVKFRPLRTAAQKAMESAKHIIADLCRDSASNGHSADLIMEAIAAGKIPGVKLEIK